jgi:hypothetical protein
MCEKKPYGMMNNKSARTFIYQMINFTEISNYHGVIVITRVTEI